MGSSVRSSPYVTCMVGAAEDETFVAVIAITTFDGPNDGVSVMTARDGCPVGTEEDACAGTDDQSNVGSNDIVSATASVGSMVIVSFK